jgi:hypothetical protein
VGLGQVAEEHLAHPGLQVDDHPARDAGGARLGGGGHHGVDGLGRVGEPGEDGGDEHPARQPPLPQLGQRLEALAGRRRAGLGRPPDVLVEGAHGEAHGHVGPLGRLGQHVGVPQHQGRLGQDGERVAGPAQLLDQAPGQVVLALGPLVRVGVGAHGDRLAAPPPGVQLGPQPLDGVDLDHHLPLEPLPDVEPQVVVRRPGEAVVADHAVGDVVPGPRGHVVERQVHPERLHRDDPSGRPLVHHVADDRLPHQLRHFSERGGP